MLTTYVMIAAGGSRITGECRVTIPRGYVVANTRATTTDIRYMSICKTYRPNC